MLDFLGIGAQKAGTTWLQVMLSQHPEINFPLGKEVHFWNHQYKGLAWYQAHFSATDTNHRQGEITPAYAFLPEENIKTIYHYYPDIHLIYLMRNPIERAWSSALMALKRAELIIDETSEQWFIDHFYSQGSLQRGDYESCIRTWRSVFPEEQLLLLFYDDIAKNPQYLLSQCCTHLNIDSNFFSALASSQLNRRVFSGSGYPLRPSLRLILNDLYFPKIKSLSNYLDHDLSHWLK